MGLIQAVPSHADNFRIFLEFFLHSIRTGIFTPVETFENVRLKSFSRVVLEDEKLAVCQRPLGRQSPAYVFDDFLISHGMCTELRSEDENGNFEFFELRNHPVGFTKNLGKNHRITIGNTFTEFPRSERRRYLPLHAYTAHYPVMTSNPFSSY